MGSTADDLWVSPEKAEDYQDAESRVGEIVAGTYRIARHIGSGGSCHVYEVKHLRSDRLLALKLLRPRLGNHLRTAQRFRREAKAIARVQSEHVVGVIDCGELEDHTPYLVMELLQGEDLRNLLLKERQLPVRRALSIALDTCRGLAAVHRAGLVHRDLKPENLFIARHDTGEDWCKVLDFGVAKMEASQATAQGAIIGTVRYMAPEQLADGAAVGPATDLYAIGAILYECLAGKPLVSGASVQEAMYQIINVEAPPLGAVRPELPASVCDLVERCLAKPPSARPESASRLANAIEDLLRSRPAAATDFTRADDAPRIPAEATRTFRLHRPLVVLAALSFAGILGWFLRGATGTAAAMSDGRTPPATRSSAPEVVTQASATAARTPDPPGATAGDSGSATKHPREKGISGPERGRDARPSVSTGVPKASATPPMDATVGRFDSANPYE